MEEIIESINNGEGELGEFLQHCRTENDRPELGFGVSACDALSRVYIVRRRVSRERRSGLRRAPPDRV